MKLYERVPIPGVEIMKSAERMGYSTVNIHIYIYFTFIYMKISLQLLEKTQIWGQGVKLWFHLYKSFLGRMRPLIISMIGTDILIICTHKTATGSLKKQR